MLPDFPKSRRQVAERIRLSLHLKVQNRSPLLTLGLNLTQHEGALHSYDAWSGEQSKTLTEGFKEMSVPIEIRIDEVPTLIGPKLDEKLDKVAEEFARQQSEVGYQKLDQAGVGFESAGSITKEEWLREFSRRALSFDPKTRKQETVVLLHPDIFEGLRSGRKILSLLSGITK